MHVVIFDEVRFDGAEGSDPDMESEKGVVDVCQHLGSEVEASRWCGDSSLFAGESRLVAVPVGAVTLPVHVVGQGELAVGFLVDLFVPGDDSVTAFEDGFHRACRVTNFNRASGFHFFAGANQALPDRGAEFVGADELDFVVVGKEPGRGDLGVVEDDEVVRVEVVREIGEHPMFYFSTLTVNDHHS